MLAKEFSCSIDPLADLIDLHNQIQKRFTHIYLLDKDSQEFSEMGNGLIYHAEVFMKKNTPIEVIQQFSTLFEENISFVRFFWVNYMTVKLREKIYLTKGILNEVFICEEALISLISYIKEKFHILDGTKRELFAEHVLNFYYTKLRKNIIEFLKEKRPGFLQIDREFAQLQKSLSSDFHNYTIPECCIYSTLYEDYQNLIINPSELNNKIKFFFHVKYFIQKFSIYKVLTWLVYQNNKFIKDFLAISTLKSIDIFTDFKIPESDPPIWIYIKGLHQICPIFEWSLKAVIPIVVPVSQEQVQSCPTLENFTVDEILGILNLFHHKISK
jgi:hypothetical protein